MSLAALESQRASECWVSDGSNVACGLGFHGGEHGCGLLGDTILSGEVDVGQTLDLLTRGFFSRLGLPPLGNFAVDVGGGQVGALARDIVLFVEGVFGRVVVGVTVV